MKVGQYYTWGGTLEGKLGSVKITHALTTTTDNKEKNQSGVAGTVVADIGQLTNVLGDLCTLKGKVSNGIKAGEMLTLKGVQLLGVDKGLGPNETATFIAEEVVFN